MNKKLYTENNILNFRDLGGYKNNEGKEVKYGHIFRSSPIVFKDELSKSKYLELGIDAIIDFRGDEEANNRPDEVTKEEYYHICAIDDQQFKGSLNVHELLKNNEMEALYTYMKRIYTIIPFNNPAYKKMFELLLNNKKIVFHCSAGKDRTGFAAYMILRALGVDHETCMKDYLLSNEYLGEGNKEHARNFGHDELANLLFFVHERNMNYAFDAIYKKYSSFEEYLLNEYDLDETKINRLKELYLYD